MKRLNITTFSHLKNISENIYEDFEFPKKNLKILEECYYEPRLPRLKDYYEQTSIDLDNDINIIISNEDIDIFYKKDDPEKKIYLVFSQMTEFDAIMVDEKEDVDLSFVNNQRVKKTIKALSA